MSRRRALRTRSFLTSGLASVLAVTTVGLAAEIGVVGREGFIGGLHLIGPVDAPTHCRMQLAGAATRVPFNHLQKAFQQDEDVHRRILEFVQAQTHGLSQVAGCHRVHDASQRLTRWLLTAQDLTKSSTIDIPQEVLSENLGTKRVTIAAAAGKLQRDKLIEYDADISVFSIAVGWRHWLATVIQRSRPSTEGYISEGMSCTGPLEEAQ